MAAELEQDGRQQGAPTLTNNDQQQQRQQQQRRVARQPQPPGQKRRRHATPLSLADVLSGLITSALYTTATYPVHR